MKTKITLICLFLALTSGSKAQNYVTIPDSNFVAYLQANFPSSMNGNQLDTTSTNILAQTSLITPSNISDLTGVQYFKNLSTLICTNGQLTNLPFINNLLTLLDCSGNHLINLPSLPNSLKHLDCYINQLTTIPPLPASLLGLNCEDNNLTSIPVLPDSLTLLYCKGNHLTSLPVLPNLLDALTCYNNQLTSLPYLPNSLTKLYCGQNNIYCFQKFSNSITTIDISGNPFSCLPNYLPGMDSISLAHPLCGEDDFINNPNGCPIAKGLVGVVYRDNNNNCIQDYGDFPLNNILLRLFNNNSLQLAATYTFQNGIYNFADTSGTYTVTVDTAGMPFTIHCNFPGEDSTVTLSNSNPLASNVNFEIGCKPGFDIGVQSVVTNGLIFPGNPHQLKLIAGDMSHWYNLNCATGVSGHVKITVTGNVTYNGIVPGALTPIISGNVFNYNILDFGTINYENDFGLIFTTDTTAQLLDIICINVLMTPALGDNDTSNNTFQFCYQVDNSFDPNLKEVYPVNVQPGYHDWFTYTIHFQNTVSAPAINIRLADTLDTNLDLETFQVINYSHYNTVSLQNNSLTFRFPNIMLSDSASNPEGSKGFVQYRIKPKPNLPLGTQIKNTANIYFDYNSPIITNTTINKYTQTASVGSNFESRNLHVNIYPNPGNGKYSIKLPEGINISELSLEVYNLLGEQVFKTKL